jgi:hypothetical protein
MLFMTSPPADRLRPGVAAMARVSNDRLGPGDPFDRLAYRPLSKNRATQNRAATGRLRALVCICAVKTTIPRHFMTAIAIRRHSFRP